MATILDRLSPGAQVAGQMGKGFGSALEGLIGNKLKQMQTQTGLMSLVGPEQAEALAYLPPELLKTVVPELRKTMRDTDLSKMKMAGSLAAQEGASLFGPTSETTEKQPESQIQASPLETQMQDQFSQQIPSLEKASIAEGGSGLQQQITPKSGAFAGVSIPSPSEIVGNLKNSSAFQAASGEQQEKILDSALKQRDKELERDLKERQLESRTGRETRRERTEKNKENRSDIRDLTKSYKTTKDNIARLKKMRELIKSGKMADSRLIGAMSIIPRVGSKTIGWFSPETQEFFKLSNDMLRSAPDVFGSNMSATSAELFLKMVPNINQSDDAKLAVIDNIMSLSRKVGARYKSMNKIIDKYGENNIPGSIGRLVEKAAKPKLKALQKKFTEKGQDYSKYKPKSLSDFLEVSDKDLLGQLKGMGSGLVNLFK